MRTDVFVENDSGGMSLLSSSVADRVIADARGDDGQFVRAHQAILGLLVGDDAFIARVVVDEPLSPEERDQWIAHYRWALEVPCGRLLVCGGFDPDVIRWWRDQEPHSRGVQEVAVPPGKYLVDVYTYLHSMNGRVILDDVWEDKLGRWFRRDHPGRAFPAWVAGELAVFHEFDPGHEKEWKALKASVEAGTLEVETAPLDWVGFVVHLLPFDPAASLTEPEEGDWFGAGQGLRRPEVFPLGIAAHGAEDPEYRDALKDLLPPRPVPEVPLVHLDVFSRVADVPLTPLSGGTVSVPAARLERVFRLAWFATGLAHPELRLEGPGVAGLANRFALPVLPVPVGEALHVRFPDDGTRFGTLHRVRDLGPEPWRQVPPGTVLEMATFPQDVDGEADPGIGLLRFRGPLGMEGGEPVWTIQEAYPAVTADRLNRALALSAASESADTLRLGNPEEAQRVLEAFQKKWRQFLFPWVQLEQHGAEIRMTPPDDASIQFLALAAFRTLHGDVWPHEPALEEDDEEE